jgi:hypothetical protein
MSTIRSIRTSSFLAGIMLAFKIVGLMVTISLLLSLVQSGHKMEKANLQIDAQTEAVQEFPIPSDGLPTAGFSQVKGQAEPGDSDEERITSQAQADSLSKEQTSRDLLDEIPGSLTDETPHPRPGKGIDPEEAMEHHRLIFRTRADQQIDQRRSMEKKRAILE